ncbi:MAG: peptidylprolyl isomerase [Chitinophagaceae bacterium]|nr:peptidylprolyl isomerase [Chitinophagaceae bacterium]
MKTGFTFLLLFFSIVVFAQPTVREQFEKIKTQQDAQKFIDANAPLKPVLMHLTLGKDSTLIDKRLLKQNKGDIFSVGYVTYLVLDGTESVNYRAQYIFLDGGSLTASEIDNLKKVITQKISAGEALDKLSDQYTMDGNSTKGDTGWFFGEEMMPKEFQEAVKDHKKGDMFFVDVPEKDWHYIVVKTYDDEVKKEITVLRANGR